MHLAHAVDPTPDWYAPATHAPHVPALVAPAAAEDVPLGHKSHPADPFFAWYAPAGHAWQLPTTSDLVAFRNVPAGHRSHGELLAVALE